MLSSWEDRNSQGWVINGNNVSCPLSQDKGLGIYPKCSGRKKKPRAIPTTTFKYTYLRDPSPDLKLKQYPSLREGSQYLSLMCPGFQGMGASLVFPSLDMER